MWPLSRLGPECSAGPSEGFLAAQYEEWREGDGGGQTMAKRSGQTLDSAGAALASCSVELFLENGDVMLRECQSDLAGNYEVLSQYTGQSHYVVARKTGVGGVSGSFNIP